jgi:protein O-mannosyl-transferase
MLKLKCNIKYYLASFVSLMTFLVYIPALWNGFIWWWDDGQYVVDNFHIRLLDMAFFKWAFFSFYENNWHPLTWISHACDYAVWGTNPLGHHLTNIILHALNTALVIILVIRLLEMSNIRTVNAAQPAFLGERTRLITAGTTGALFGLHPVHVQSVAWVAERKDVLCAFFFLLSIIAYTGYIRSADDNIEKEDSPLRRFCFNKYYLLSLVLFILALLSKPMAVSLPIILLILDWYPFDRVKSLTALRSVLVEKLPFIAMSLISSVLTVLSQRAGGALGTLSWVPLSTRLLVAGKFLIFYVGFLICPLHLVPFHAYPDHASLFSLEYLSAFALLAGIVSACIVMAKKQRLWLATWSYYVVTLAPVLGIIQVGGQAMADRYLYLPSLGPFLIAGLGTAWITNKVADPRTRNLMVKACCAVAAFVLFATLSYLTIKQIGIWKNDIVFWSFIIDHDPGKFSRAYNNRGVAYVKEGLTEQAIDDFNRAIAMDPSYDEAFYGRGTAYDKMGDFDRALENFNKAIALDPFYFEVFLARGMLYEKTGQIEKAIDDIKRAIALNPLYDEAYFRLGNIYAQRGIFDQAVNYYNSAISANPNYAESYINRAISNSLIGRQDQALRDFNRALLLDHSNPVAYLNRGDYYFREGKRELALADFKKACDLGSKDGCRTLYQLQNPANKSYQ